MYQHFSELVGCEVFASGQHLGSVVDLLLDEDRWIVRYVVVAVPLASSPGRFLLAPASIESLDTHGTGIATSLDPDVANSVPLLTKSVDVSESYEMLLVEHFGWPIYWLGRHSDSVSKPAAKILRDESDDSITNDLQSRLRSAESIIGSKIIDGKSLNGSVGDLVTRVDSWTIDYVTAKVNPQSSDENVVYSTSQIRPIEGAGRVLVLDPSKKLVDRKPVPVFESLREPIPCSARRHKKG